MQREIKFRAWTDIGIVDRKMYYQRLTDYLTPVFTPAGYGLFNPTLRVMQFTGLKDKNGKEIYEGDIITIYGYEMNYEIIFKSGCFGFEVINPINKISYNFATFKNIDQEYVDCEVLGNIFENPDLLK